MSPIVLIRQTLLLLQNKVGQMSAFLLQTVQNKLNEPTVSLSHTCVFVCVLSCVSPFFSFFTNGGSGSSTTLGVALEALVGGPQMFYGKCTKYVT